LDRTVLTKFPSPAPPSRRGIGAIEVLVATLLVAVVGLMLLAALPRRREASREASCRRNLARIGVALTLYDQAHRRLPTVPALAEPAGAGPLATLLGGLGRSDLDGLEAAPAAPPAIPPGGAAAPAVPRRLVGFLCPSDRAPDGDAPAPTSYRANTGSRPDGGDGPFAPGVATSLAEVEGADGLAYTAGFAERLRGDRRPAPPSPGHVRVVPAPVPPDACPPAGGLPPILDAGSNWALASWRDSLYNHALPPGAPASCLAADRRTAHLVPSSGHAAGVNVLMLDLSVRTLTPRVDPGVWRRLGAVDDGQAPPPGPER
jgi:type II secretory pathway pseudopilin PulG